MYFCTEFEDSILETNMQSKKAELLDLIDEPQTVQRNILGPMLASNTTNSTNYYTNNDQYTFSECNFLSLKENIEPALQVSSAKPNGREPDFSLYSKYLRPNYNSTKKKKTFEEQELKTPSVDVVNIYSLGIGPEIKSDFDKLMDKFNKCFKLFRMLKSEIQMIELSVFKSKITRDEVIGPHPTNIQKQYNLLSQIAIEEYMKLETFLPKFENFLLTKNVEFKSGSEIILKEFLNSVKLFQEMEIFNKSGIFNDNFSEIFFVIDDLALSIKYATSDLWMLKEMFLKMGKKSTSERYRGSSNIL